MIKAVKRNIEKDPRTGIRQLAKAHNMAPSSMLELVRKDLNLVLKAVTPCQTLTTAQREKRLKRAKKKLNWMKSNSGKVVVFSDEINFYVDAVTNRRNTRYLANKPMDVNPSIRYTPKSKFPAKATMLGMVCSNGLALPLIWVKGNLNSTQDKLILSRKVFPALKRTYGCGNWVRQQDGAPCHVSDSIQKYLKSKLGSEGFWSKDF